MTLSAAKLHEVRLKACAYEICIAVKGRGCKCKHELNGPCDKMLLAACRADAKLSDARVIGRTSQRGLPSPESASTQAIEG